VQNPSAEVDTWGWGDDGEGGAHATIAQVTTGGQVGSAFVRATLTYAGGDLGGRCVTITAQMVETHGPCTFTVSAWVKGTAGRQVAMCVGVIADGSGTSSWKQPGTGTALTGSWQRISYTDSLAANNKMFYAGPVVMTGVVGNTIDVDGVMVELTSSLGSYFDGTSTSAADGTTVYAWVGQAHRTQSTETKQAPVSTTVRTNMVPNPSFETNVALWTAGGAGGTSTPVISWDTTHAMGYQLGNGCMKVLATATGNDSFTTASQGIPVLPINPYKCSVHFRTEGGVTRTVQMGVWWYTSTNTYISASTTLQYTVDSTNWIRCTNNSLVSPANAAYARIYIIVVGVTTTQEVIYVDGATFETSQATQFYFDGSSSNTYINTYRWLGTPHASASTQTTMTPV